MGTISTQLENLSRTGNMLAISGKELTYSALYSLAQLLQKKRASHFHCNSRSRNLVNKVSKLFKPHFVICNLIFTFSCKCGVKWRSDETWPDVDQACDKCGRHSSALMIEPTKSWRRHCSFQVMKMKGMQWTNHDSLNCVVLVFSALLSFSETSF